MRSNQIQCTYCGAILNLREGFSQIECEYCGHESQIDNLSYKNDDWNDQIIKRRPRLRDNINTKGERDRVNHELNYQYEEEDPYLNENDFRGNLKSISNKYQKITEKIAIIINESLDIDYINSLIIKRIIFSGINIFPFIFLSNLEKSLGNAFGYSEPFTIFFYLAVSSIISTICFRDLLDNSREEKMEYTLLTFSIIFGLILIPLIL